MNIPYMIAQCVAVGAYILLGIGFNKKTKIEILNFGCAAETLLGLHWYLLGAPMAVISSALSLIRNVIFMYYAEKEKELPLYYLFGFATLSIILTCIFYHDFSDVVICMITLISVYTYWASDTKKVRLGNMALCLSFLAYGIYFKAVITVLSEIYLFGATVAGYIRYEKHKFKSLQSL